MGRTNEDKAGAPPGDPARIETPEELAQALTALRQRAGLSIRRLSSITGIPPATLGGYFSGRHLPSVSQGGALEDMLAGLGVEDQTEVDAWLDAVRRLRTRPTAAASPQRPNPYRGLRSFTEQDAELFFGRETYVDTVLEQLERQREAGPGLVALVAPSGAGKSSLLRGGVLPALCRAHPTAKVAVLVPGADPLAALDGAGESDVLIVDQLEELFARGVPAAASDAFIDRLTALTRTDPDTGRRDTIVLFGVRADFYDRVLGVPALVPALQQAQVVLGPMEEAELRRAIVEPAKSVGVTVEDALVTVLLRELAPRGPSEGTAAHRNGVLPLLSHALMTAWERHTGDRLTVGDYLATGGIAGAVQASAEAAFATLSSDEQEQARRLFTRLVNVDEDGVLTRRRVRHDELAGLPHGVLEAFVSARLLTATDTTVEVSHEALLEAWPRLWEWIEADRDALRARRRIGAVTAAWEEQRRDPAMLLRGAPLAAAVELLEDPRDLLAPVEREFVERSRAQERIELEEQRRRSRRLSQLLAGATVLAVVAASLALFALDSRNEAQAQRAAATRARDAALSRQVAAEADRRMQSSAPLAKLLAATAFDISPTLKARSSLLDATAHREATRFVGPDGSMHTSGAADGTWIAHAGADGTVRIWQRSAEGSYERVARAVGDEQGGLLFASALSPDERLLAVGGISGTVRLLDVTDPADPRLVATLDEPDSAVQALAFSPDGSALAAATSDPAVFRWRLSGDRPEGLPRIRGFDGEVRSLAYAPSAPLLATGSADGMLRLWAVAGNKPRLLSEEQVGAPGNAVLSTAFSPSEPVVAVGSKDKVVRLWSVADPRRPRPLDGPATRMESFVNSLAFSSDGGLLAAGGANGYARVWDVDTGQERSRIQVSANVTNVAFTDSDRALLTGSLDGTGRLWALAAPSLGGFEDNIWSLGFDAGGDRLLVAPGTEDGALHLYDVPPGGVFGPSAGPALTLRAPDRAGVLDGAAALSPSGELVAGGTSTGHVVVWSLATGAAEPLAVLQPSTELIEAVTFGDGGRLLASVGDDGAVVVWDVDQLGSRSADAEVARATVDTIPLGVAFSPDASMLAVTGADNRVHLWSLDEAGAMTERLDPLTGFDNYAVGAGFSPDGSLLAVGSSDATVRVWDVSDPHSIRPVGRPLTGPTDTIYSVDWHPESRILAAASTDGSVWLWDLASPSAPEPLADLLALEGDAFTVTFSPDGKRLAAAGSGRTVRLWEIDPGAATDAICRTSGSGLTRGEWRRLVPGVPYDPPCPSR